MRLRAFAAAVLALAGVLAGCAASEQPAPPVFTGPPSRFPEPLPPPAEPALAPPVAVAPAGRVLAVGAGAEGIVADPVTRTVAVGVRDPNQLALLGADTATIFGHVQLPGELRHLQLAAPGGPVLVPDESSDSLLRVALPSGAVLSHVPTGAHPHDANQAPNGTTFVANEFGGTVVAVRDDRVLHTFTDVTQPAGLAHVGNVVGLVDVRENTLTCYDATTLTPITELPAGSGPTHLVADAHGRMIVVDTRGGAILLFQPAPQARLLARIELAGAPYGVAYDGSRDRLWVTVTAANQLVGFDLSQPTPREVARIPTVRQPNTVAVDASTGRLFVTGTADGTVEVIDP